MFKEFSEYLFKTYLPGAHTWMTWNKYLFSWRSATCIHICCLAYISTPVESTDCWSHWNLLGVSAHWVCRPSTCGDSGLSSFFCSYFLLRCKWMCNWLPSLWPQLCVCQLAGKLQVWVPEWLWVCRRPAHLRLWVPKLCLFLAKIMLNLALGLITVSTSVIQKFCWMVF